MKELIEKSSSLIIGAFIILLVSLSWIFVSQGKAMIGNAGKSLQRQNAHLAAGALKPFSNRLVSGDSVISCIYSMESGEPVKAGVVVRNADGTVAGEYAWRPVAEGGLRFFPYEIPEGSTVGVINPTGKYRAKIIKDANGVEQAIEFTAQI